VLVYFGFGSNRQAGPGSGSAISVIPGERRRGAAARGGSGRRKVLDVAPSLPANEVGRQQDLRLGPYPRLSLKAARQKRDEQKLLLQEQGIDPCKAKKLTRSEQRRRAAGPTFKEVAEDWHSTKTAGTWSERHSDDVAKKLARDILPALGGRPIEAITTQDCLAVLRAIEQRGWNETAKRTLGVISLVMDYAVALGHCPHNPAHALKRHAPVKQINSHFPCIGLRELAELLGAMRANTIHADASTLNAMWLLALTFVRTSELIAAQWVEIDRAEALWTVPAERMKGRRGSRRENLVPLSRQAVRILETQWGLTGSRGYVFKSVRTGSGHISNNTVNMALKRMGFDGQMCGHGFRALAMTNVQEQLGIDLRIVDRQLAHIEKNKVMAAYNRAEYWPQRVEMMQRWADLLDQVG
jgi:integrase